MLLILVAAKRLVLLAYYHEESLKSYQSIRFEPTTDGIFVWFNQPLSRPYDRGTLSRPLSAKRFSTSGTPIFPPI